MSNFSFSHSVFKRLVSQVPGALKGVIVLEWVNHLQKEKTLEWKLKAFACSGNLENYNLKAIIFYSPAMIDRCHIVFGLSVCLYVCASICLCVQLAVRSFLLLFVCRNFYIGYIFRLVTFRAFIFDMNIHCNQDLSVGNKFKVICEGQGQISRS